MSNNNEKSLAIVPRSLAEVESLADKFAKSTLMPDALRNRPADVFVSIMAGQELGLTPMAALRGVHVVQGKPILSADTMVALILGSGLAEYFVCVDESTTSATYETKRKGTPKAQRCTWSLADAETAGLVKDGGNWKKHPRAMLKARAKAMLARDVYPDVLAGCYEEDEAREFTQPPPRRNDAIDVEVVERPAPLPASDAADVLIADIETAPTVADLDSLAPRFAAFPKGTQVRARVYEAFKARRAALAEPAPQETAA